jgi:hypothetical protein
MRLMGASVLNGLLAVNPGGQLALRIPHKMIWQVNCQHSFIEEELEASN